MMADYVVSISSGVYTRGMGGTNKVIMSHQKMFNGKGLSYVYLCPVNNAITKRSHANTKGYWNLIIDGIYKGVVTSTGFWLFREEQLKLHNKELAIFIHHIKDIDIDEMTKLLEQNKSFVYMYIHDYYTICENYNLLNEKGQYCGLGAKIEVPCESCLRYSSSKLIRNSFGKLVGYLAGRIKFIAPSDAAKQVWSVAYPQYADLVQVIYHQNMVGKHIPEYREIFPTDQIKIGFIGAALKSKGWDDFIDVVDQIPDDMGYQFFHFGIGGEHGKIKSIEIMFHDQLNAMIEALRGKKIDVAILWSIWPETYSYTYYETYASNAYIITNINSGNMKNQVEKNRNGIVLQDKNELLALLQNKSELVRLVNEYRKMNIDVPQDLIENDEIVTIVLQQTNNSMMERPLMGKKHIKITEKILCRLFAMCERITVLIKEGKFVAIKI